MSKTLIWTIVVIVVIAGAWYWMSQGSSNAPTASNSDNSANPANSANPGSTVSADNTASMSSDLNGISIQDPNFQVIDQDTNLL